MEITNSQQAIKSVASTDRLPSKPTKTKIGQNPAAINQVKAMILDHLVQVGRTYDLPSDQQEQHVFVSRWHQTVCEENSHWPADVDVVQVYKDFFRAVRDGRFKMPNFSAYSHSQAFKEWAKNGLAKHKPKQKALPQSSVVPEKLESTYARETDAQLLESHQGILLLMQSKSSLATRPQFFENVRCLVNEMIKRGLQPNPKLLEL